MLFDRFIWNNYVTFNNGHSKLSCAETTISSTDSLSGSWVRYTDDARTPFIQSYTTGGIYNLAPYDLKVLLIMHLNVECTVASNTSGAWIGVQIQQKASGSAQYARYWAGGTSVSYASGSRTVIVDRTIAVTIPTDGAIGVTLYKSGTNTTTATVQGGSWVQVQPLSLYFS